MFKRCGTALVFCVAATSAEAKAAPLQCVAMPFQADQVIVTGQANGQTFEFRVTIDGKPVAMAGDAAKPTPADQQKVECSLTS